MLPKLYRKDSSLVFQDKSKADGYNNSTTENARAFGHLHSLVQTLLQPILQTIFKSLQKVRVVLLVILFLSKQNTLQSLETLL
ncbi:MAG: hypothetical protein CM15mV95_310 [Caudoviricetes sp.]|nr:MAG: hypothetical protein CM15mV95_310 [Caudoviricetes sp.]